MSRILTVQQHGIKLGTAGRGSSENLPPERTQIGGWSAHAIRRNNDFLRSVDYSSLDHLAGFAFTGTVRDCPPSSDEWHKVLRLFFDRLMRSEGCLLIHWVIEWQRRGVPHLHCSLFFDNPPIDIQQKIIAHWVALTGKWGAGPFGQHIAHIHDSLGWHQYTSKHAQRGLSHYQRSPENVPAEWLGKTGRMWGKRGPWPVIEPMKFTIPDKVFYPYRRLLRAWRKADARASGCRSRIRSARRMLNCNDRSLSAVRGCSEWMNQTITTDLLLFLSRDCADQVIQVG